MNCIDTSKKNNTSSYTHVNKAGSILINTTSKKNWPYLSPQATRFFIPQRTSRTKWNTSWMRQKRNHWRNPKRCRNFSTPSNSKIHIKKRKKYHCSLVFSKRYRSNNKNYWRRFKTQTYLGYFWRSCWKTLLWKFKTTF